jgi:hypothetical protein
LIKSDDMDLALASECQFAVIPLFIVLAILRNPYEIFCIAL